MAFDFVLWHTERKNTLRNLLKFYFNGPQQANVICKAIKVTVSLGIFLHVRTNEPKKRENMKYENWQKPLLVFMMAINLFLFASQIYSLLLPLVSLGVVENCMFLMQLLLITLIFEKNHHLTWNQFSQSNKMFPWNVDNRMFCLNQIMETSLLAYVILFRVFS